MNSKFQIPGLAKHVNITGCSELFVSKAVCDVFAFCLLPMIITNAGGGCVFKPDQKTHLKGNIDSISSQPLPCT